MIQFRNTLCFDRRQVIQHTDRAFTIIADEDHIATGVERCLTAFGIAAHDRRPFHRQIVGENHPVKAQFAAQHRFQPVRRAAGRTRIELRVNHMRRHNGIQTLLGDKAFEHRHIMVADNRCRPRIERRLFVRIGSHRPVSREVFAGGFHARGVHPVNEVTRHRQRFLRIFMIRTFADCGADMADVQHWRKTNIDIHGDHFAGHQPAGFGGQFAPLFHPQQRGERLGRR